MILSRFIISIVFVAAYLSQFTRCEHELDKLTDVVNELDVINSNLLDSLDGKAHKQRNIIKKAKPIANAMAKPVANTMAKPVANSMAKPVAKPQAKPIGLPPIMKWINGPRSPKKPKCPSSGGCPGKGGNSGPTPGRGVVNEQQQQVVINAAGGGGNNAVPTPPPIIITPAPATPPSGNTGQAPGQQTTTPAPGSTNAMPMNCPATPAGEAPATRPAFPDTTTAAFQMGCLSSINADRAMNSAPALTMDATAQMYASCRCNLISQASALSRGHNGLMGFGENIFWGEFTNGTVLDCTGASGAVAAWYAEQSMYNFTAATFNSATGHFTQLVWVASTTVGCARCGGIQQGGFTETYIVCNFAPAGNVQGGFAANVKPMTSGK